MEGSLQFENRFYNASDRTDVGGSWEPFDPDEIYDMLPLDPFDMYVCDTDASETDGSSTDGSDSDVSDLDLSATIWVRDMQTDRLNFICMDIDETLRSSCSFDGLSEKELASGSFSSGFLSSCSFGGGEKERADGSLKSGFVSIYNIGDYLTFSNGDSRVARAATDEYATGSCSNGDGGAPHEAMFYALGYLGVQDLLSVESVCRSLRSAVQDDNLLWRSIYIDQPLSERICDDSLLRLTDRANGNMRCLTLVKCGWITNDGLKRVLQSNPRITELNVPGCSKLSVEGIVNDLKASKSSEAPGMTHVRLGNRFDVTYKQFEDLKILLNADKPPLKAHKPRFYHEYQSNFSCDDGRNIDMEICPRCKNVRLVYDCPLKSCTGKQPSSMQCRACVFCILRCIQCGRCIHDSEYEETFCMDVICLDCFKDLLFCQERHEENSLPLKHTVIHQETRYHLHLRG